MRHSFSLGLLLAAVATLAAAEDQIVVQIICDKAGQVSNGSGVIVSSHGHILTAAHVMPEGSTCTATIGTTTGEPIPLKSIRRASNDLDAILAKLDSVETFVRFATVCPLEKEREIVTAGFHSRLTGKPARKDGIISKIEMERGTVEITAPVIPAESGGPVFLRGTTAIVGIVWGADFDALGMPVRRMVPTEALMDLDLVPAPDCRPKEEALTAAVRALVEGLEQEKAQAASAAGIREKAIIFLAQRISSDTDTFEQALTEMENAVDIAIEMRKRGKTPSDAGAFVDEVLQEVAQLAGEGALEEATQAVDDALVRLDSTEEAIRIARIDLLQTGIDTDLLRRDVPSAVARILHRVALQEPDSVRQFEALRQEQEIWYVRGRDKGINLDLQVAIALAKAAVQRAADPDETGAANNDLGNALSDLGARESGTARLQEAVAAYRAALEARTRDRVPLDWATTQNNLGTALRALGARESGTARLEEAVAAYRAALEVWTRDRVPLNWAATQNNLGNALQTLSARERGTARLQEAVTAYRAALEEWTRDRVPLNWAATQNNLGTALRALGIRETGTARLQEAVAAYRAALEERTRDRVPLEWAMTQNNLGTALRTLGERETGTARLQEAVAAYRAALEERTRDRVPLDWAYSYHALAHAKEVLFDRTGTNSFLIEAIADVEKAKEIYEMAEINYWLPVANNSLDRLRSKLPPDWASAR